MVSFIKLGFLYPNLNRKGKKKDYYKIDWKYSNLDKIRIF